MLKEEWLELDKMHKELNDNGFPYFSSDFLERYSELFAKSLRDKGDGPISTGSINTMV